MVTDFKKKKKGSLGQRLLVYGSGVVILAVLVSLIVANIKINKKRQEFTTQISSLKQQIEDVKSQNNNLQEGISKKDDSQYIEKVAREELDLQKEGEKVVSFVMPKTEGPETAATNQNPVQSWLGNLWNWIRGKE